MSMCPSKLERLCIRSVVLLHRSLIDPDALKLISTAWLGVQCRFLLLLMIFTASNTSPNQRCAQSLISHLSCAAAGLTACKQP